VAPDGDPAVLRVLGEALGQVRRAKSRAHVSMKTSVALAEVLGPAPQLELLAAAAGDLRAAGHIERLDLLPDRTSELVVACAF
jgi:valyl-tRNA synthetase